MTPDEKARRLRQLQRQREYEERLAKWEEERRRKEEEEEALRRQQEEEEAERQYEVSGHKVLEFLEFLRESKFSKGLEFI